MQMAAVTNTELGRELNCSDAHISRLRSGDRIPSTALMFRIEEALKWPLRDQALLAVKGNEAYAAEFEERLRVKYGVTPGHE